MYELTALGAVALEGLLASQNGFGLQPTGYQESVMASAQLVVCKLEYRIWQFEHSMALIDSHLMKSCRFLEKGTKM